MSIDVTEPRPHRSISSLRQYLRCGQQWKLQRVDGLNRGSTTAAIRGTAVHLTAAFNYEHKRGRILGGRAATDLPLYQVVEFAAEAVDGGFRGAVALRPDEETVGVRNIRGRVLDEAVKMAREYHLVRAPHVRPTMVEERIRARVAPASFPHDLVGVIDVADDDGPEEIKTGRPWRQEDVDRDQQLTMEALLFKARTRALPRRCSLTSVSLRAGYPVARTMTTTRTDQDVQVLLAHFREAERGIQAGVFTPTDPGNWWCSARWCEFWRVCPYGQPAASSRPVTHEEED